MPKMLSRMLRKNEKKTLHVTVTSEKKFALYEGTKNKE